MGTNYYVKADPTCNNPAHTEELHIGKSSMGWKFGFHGIPDRGLISWRAWQLFLVGREIADEYGRTYTLEEFRSVVEDRRPSRLSDRPICRVAPTAAEAEHAYGGHYYANGDYHDHEGFDFYNGEFT